MRDEPATFSESWYRVAGRRICLRHSVKVHRQYYRGERWYVLHDPLRNQFFRLRPAAYEFVARLSPQKTVEQVWKECLDKFPDDAPGQEAVIQLLAQLYHANLLQYDPGTDAAQLFKRYQKTRQRELKARLLNVMFMRIPLIDPDSFLVRTMPLVGWLISPLGALIWFLVVGFGLKLAADNYQSLWQQAQGVIAPGNLFMLYVALVVVKTLHEFGHAFFCRRFGGEVHVMGVLFMIFTPIPYMDATSAWGFRERWKRILVGLAGILVEAFVAALAAIVWAHTGPGVVHSLAYNMMFVASVSTLVFNLNPLLRFDGYYVLSDLLGIPNLSQKAMATLRYYAERYLYGLKRDENPASTPKEAFWLATYAVASGIYRVVVFGGVLLVVADRFLLLGILMAVVCAVAWVVVPLGRLVMYLASSPRLDRYRPRALATTAAVAMAVITPLELVPLPAHFRAPGVIWSAQWSEVHNETAGVFKRVLAKPGTLVVEGQPLIELENREIEIQLAAAQARKNEIDARLRHALQEAVPNVAPLKQIAEVVEMELKRIQNDQSNLVVRARQSGIWVAPGIEQNLHGWVQKGSELGLVIDPNRFHFLATVRQEDGDRLFASPLGKAQVRLRGAVGVPLDATSVTIIPADQRYLPSPALGWVGGGPIATDLDDEHGTRAAEPFFEVRVLIPHPAQQQLLHGESGQIRFDLPSEPILPRLIRSFSQLLQKRYQL